VRVIAKISQETPYRVYREEGILYIEVQHAQVSGQERRSPAPASGERVAEARSTTPAGNGSGVKYTGRLISLDIQDAEIKGVLRLIADVSGLNVISGDDVKGTITTRLVNVPWDQALDVILRTLGLGQTREGNIIRVASSERFAKEQQDIVRDKQTIERVEELVTKVVAINYAKAAELKTNLGSLLSQRGSIMVDERTNTMIIKDVQGNLTEILALIGTLDQQTPQILIEARIVETSRAFERQLGIQWGLRYNETTNRRFPNTIQLSGGAGTSPSGGAFVVNLPAPVGLGSGAAIGLTLGHVANDLILDLQLSAMENSGQGRIISNPKITTLDNKEAVIQSGFTLPFETTSATGTKTEFVDANLNLTVTPHVTSDQFITMKVAAKRNEPDFARTSAGGAPSIVKREATTEVLVKDGHTTVIGGLYTRSTSDSLTGIPFFSKIPVLGWFFKNEGRRDEVLELLIFITPRIIRPQS